MMDLRFVGHRPIVKTVSRLYLNANMYMYTTENTWIRIYARPGSIILNKLHMLHFANLVRE